MLIVMHKGALEDDVIKVISTINALGGEAKLLKGYDQIVITVAVDMGQLSSLNIKNLPSVKEVISFSKNYELSSRKFHTSDTIISVGDVKIGADNPVVIAGPCAVESREQLLEIADIVKLGGAQFLRGGVYKPRTSPYSFQGLGEKGLEYLLEARKRTGLKIVTEVTSVTAIEFLHDYVDVFQIGARNMQNFELLKAVGRYDKPVLLKRGIAATIKEWLDAAEYILSEGNPNVILCERGIRTYENYTRNTLDISAIAAVKHLSHLPVIVDPSHATGRWYMVQPMSLAAIAAGADGLMMEVHSTPRKSLSDAEQALSRKNYFSIMEKIKKLAQCMKQEDIIPMVDL